MAPNKETYFRVLCLLIACGVSAFLLDRLIPRATEPKDYWIIAAVVAVYVLLWAAMLGWWRSEYLIDWNHGRSVMIPKPSNEAREHFQAEVRRHRRNFKLWWLAYGILVVVFLLLARQVKWQ